MKYIIYIATIIVLLGINVGVFSNLQFFSGVPNLLLLFVIIFSLENESRDFLIVAALSGMILDFYSGAFIGSFTIGFLLLALAVQAVSNSFLALEINWKYLAGLTVGGWVLVYLFVWVYGYYTYKLGWNPAFIEFVTVRNKIIPEVVYNLLLLYPMFLLGSAVKRFISLVTRRSVGE
jgi:cell shape-determining protein MreD